MSKQIRNLLEVMRRGIDVIRDDLDLLEAVRDKMASVIEPASAEPTLDPIPVGGSATEEDPGDEQNGAKCCCIYDSLLNKFYRRDCPVHDRPAPSTSNES